MNSSRLPNAAVQREPPLTGSRSRRSFNSRQPVRRAKESGLGRALRLIVGKLGHENAFSNRNFVGGLYAPTATFSGNPVRKSCQRTQRCPSRIWHSRLSIARGDGPLTKLPASLKTLP